MKEGGENVTGHNFREELYLFYLRDRGRMNRFDGVRAENSVYGLFQGRPVRVRTSSPERFIILSKNSASVRVADAQRCYSLNNIFIYAHLFLAYPQTQDKLSRVIHNLTGDMQQSPAYCGDHVLHPPLRTAQSLKADKQIVRQNTEPEEQGIRLECSARHAFKAKTAFDFLVQTIPLAEFVRV